MKELKASFFTILFIFLGLFLYTKFSGPIPFFITSLQTTKNTLFQAQGTGKATAVPDTAMVSVGITQKSSTVEDAQNKVNLASSKIIDDIKKLGIDEKDIKTANYSVNPEYDNTNGQNIVGYTVEQDLEIKIKPIENANKVVDTATADGANLVNGISFIFSDDLQKKLETSARNQAVANAKSKAQSLANASGITLGKIVDVSEDNQSAPMPLREPMLSAGAQKVSAPSTNITPGQNTVTITVTLSYETY